MLSMHHFICLILYNQFLDQHWVNQLFDYCTERWLPGSHLHGSQLSNWSSSTLMLQLPRKSESSPGDWDSGVSASIASLRKTVSLVKKFCSMLCRLLYLSSITDTYYSWIDTDAAHVSWHLHVLHEGPVSFLAKSSDWSQDQCANLILYSEMCTASTSTLHTETQQYNSFVYFINCISSILWELVTP